MSQPNEQRAEREAPMYFEAVSVKAEMPGVGSLVYIIDIDENPGLAECRRDSSGVLYFKGYAASDVTHWLRPIDTTTLQGEVERLKSEIKRILEAVAKSDTLYASLNWDENGMEEPEIFRLRKLADKVYAYCHMNKAGGYNGEDRAPEKGSIYELALQALNPTPHER